MIIKVLNENPFQILTSAMSIGPSETGYVLEVSADSVNFSPLFSVAANTTKMATGLAPNSYYRLKGNEGEVTVNWSRSCVTAGGGSASGNELVPQDNFPLDAVAGTVVALKDGGVYQYDGTDWNEIGSADMSEYWTSAQTQSAITQAVSGFASETYVDTQISGLTTHLNNVEEVTSIALNDLNERVIEISGSTVDLSAYWTSAETQSAITQEVSGISLDVLRVSDSFESGDAEGDVRSIRTVESSTTYAYWDEPVVNDSESSITFTYHQSDNTTKGLLGKIQYAASSTIIVDIISFSADTATYIQGETNDGTKTWDFSSTGSTSDYIKFSFISFVQIYGYYYVFFAKVAEGNGFKLTCKLTKIPDSDPLPDGASTGNRNRFNPTYGLSIVDAINENIVVENSVVGVYVKGESGNTRLIDEEIYESSTQAISVALNQLNNTKVSSTDIRNIVKMTQAQYDALSGNTEATTLYVITSN